MGIIKIASGILLVAAMSFAFIFGYDLFTQSDYFRTQNISIQGSSLLDNQDVIHRPNWLPA